MEVRCLPSPPMTTQEQIIKDFSAFEDWMEKYDHLISIGKSLPKMDEKIKTEDILIRGCQSKVWLYSELVNGKLIFIADSDAAITKGMISILLKAFSGLTPSEILNGNLDFISDIGLMQHISSTRSNGLLSMFNQIKSDAKKHLI